MCLRGDFSSPACHDCAAEKTPPRVNSRCAALSHMPRAHCCLAPMRYVDRHSPETTTFSFQVAWPTAYPPPPPPPPVLRPIFLPLPTCSLIFFPLSHSSEMRHPSSPFLFIFRRQSTVQGGHHQDDNAGGGQGRLPGAGEEGQDPRPHGPLPRSPRSVLGDVGGALPLVSTVCLLPLLLFCLR